MLYKLPGAPTLNPTSADEHEPNIERRIRVVKERTWAVRHSLPFTAIPVRMLTLIRKDKLNFTDSFESITEVDNSINRGLVVVITHVEQ